MVANGSLAGSADFQGCDFCLFNKAGLCSGAPTENASQEIDVPPALRPSRHTIHARQMIHSPRELYDYVICMCAGQAVSSIGLPDGRRQILAVLLPGDLIFWTSLFEPMSGRLIEATQNSTYRMINRTAFFAYLQKQPEIFNMFIEICVNNKNWSDQLALTLGRRNALQRISRLILDLAQKLIDRHLADEQTIAFPLRLRHVADATGMTPVHTSKILQQLRREKVIDLEDRSLRVIDMMQLRLIAGP